MKYFILVISAYIVCATDDRLNSKDNVDADLVSERINPLQHYIEASVSCSDKVRRTCRDQDGVCVPQPFDVNCSKGRINPKGCRSKYCACCLPEQLRLCTNRITPKCTKYYGTCVMAPFKQNCKNGTLEKKWCKSRYCQCCVPDVTPPPPTVCPPSLPPVTCPTPPPPVACPAPVTCSPTPPPVTCPPLTPPVTCPPSITCPSQVTCPPTHPPVTCPPPPTTPSCPQVNETELCPEIPKSFIDWENCSALLESPTEEITELDESYYLSRNFIFQNGHLILKPKLGEYFNWLDSIKRCQDLNSEPFIPKSQEDWDMLREISQDIGDTKSYNMWLPASDRGTEGVLKWLPVDVASDDPLIPWNQCTKMKTNSKPRDCLQLWSGNGYKATMDNCINYKVPHHYYPMVCEATLDGVDESFYLSNNFTDENGILVLKPVFGQYMTWLESIKRCRDLKSEPFIPRTESDWEWLRIVSSKIDDPRSHNLWLPASDRNVEGTLKWLPTKDDTHDPLIPWVKGEVMRMNSHSKDCLQLWSGNGYFASVDECEQVETPNHYYPMVCKATFRGITTKL